MKEIKLFYCDYDRDESIESDDAEHMTAAQAVSLMENLFFSDGNFLGLELPGGEIVQFMYDDAQGLLLDIPDVEKGGSYVKAIDREECLQIIRDMYDGKKPGDIPGLRFDSY